MLGREAGDHVTGGAAERSQSV